MIGILQVLASGICFAMLGIFGKLAERYDLSVGELLTWRFTTAGLLLWLYFIIFKRPQIKLSKKQILICFALGFLGYAVFSTFYFTAIRGISVALAAMLLFTFPIFVNIGNHFILKEKLTFQQFVNLSISTIGLVVLLWGDFFANSLWYVLSGIASGFTYSIYVLASGKLQRNTPALTSSLYVISAAALALGLFHQPDITRIPHFSSEQILIILGIAVICTIAPLTFFLLGLQKMSSSRASLLVMVEPVTAAVAAYFFLGEGIGIQQLVGSILVLTGVFLDSRTTVSNR